MEQEILFANVSCPSGFHLSGTEDTSHVFQCLGSFWDSVLNPCVGKSSSVVQGPCLSISLLVSGVVLDSVCSVRVMLELRWMCQ